MKMENWRIILAPKSKMIAPWETQASLLSTLEDGIYIYILYQHFVAVRRSGSKQGALEVPQKEGYSQAPLKILKVRRVFGGRGAGCSLTGRVQIFSMVSL